ncbi:hypothetical protein [Anaerocolumna sp.]|uniref:hypothetical protein n=1 Tax=Anaerocolumna sp. TaxID=2041569 RepID=UPI0028A70F94|nr:hypothetical protein [Anaerocolumna sp.]
MKRSFKLKISKALSCNTNLNRQAIRIKRSWDEVEAIICRKKCPKKCDSHKHKW